MNVVGGAEGRGDLIKGDRRREAGTLIGKNRERKQI